MHAEFPHPTHTQKAWGMTERRGEGFIISVMKEEREDRCSAVCVSAQSLGKLKFKITLKHEDIKEITP